MCGGIIEQTENQGGYNFKPLRIRGKCINTILLFLTREYTFSPLILVTEY